MRDPVVFVLTLLTGFIAGLLLRGCGGGSEPSVKVDTTVTVTTDPVAFNWSSPDLDTVFIPEKSTRPSQTSTASNDTIYLDTSSLDTAAILDDYRAVRWYGSRIQDSLGTYKARVQYNKLDSLSITVNNRVKERTITRTEHPRFLATGSAGLHGLEVGGLYRINRLYLGAGYSVHRTGQDGLRLKAAYEF